MPATPDMQSSLRFLPAGDRALVVELGDSVRPEINRQVHDLLRAVEERALAGVVDLVPTYRSLLVEFDPTTSSVDQLKDGLAEAYAAMDQLGSGEVRVVHIPTLYGGELGPDLPFVAEHAGLTAERVVDIHAGTDYLVYMIGFTPGFPYLGGMSDEVATPRLDTPRAQIPGGSVGIADNQTGVYPVASPGGWRLIGRTPLELFRADREPPALVTAGDHVRFVPLADEAEYAGVLEQVESGEYQPTVESTR